MAFYSWSDLYSRNSSYDTVGMVHTEVQVTRVVVVLVVVVIITSL